MTDHSKKENPWIQRAEDAANYLTETDRQIAELRINYERCKRIAKREWSAIFLRVDGSVEARKAQAETDPVYKDSQDAEMDALLAFEKLRNERDTAETVIEFWRSYNKATADGLV